MFGDQHSSNLARATVEKKGKEQTKQKREGLQNAGDGPPLGFEN
jgi:hypothetical protein